MHHEGTIIRPPSEAESILLQVTLGCSHGKCAFCGAYRGKRFAIKDPDIVRADIAFAAEHCGFLRRVFLCDGDALIIPQARLETILHDIRHGLPRVTRVATYANAKSIAMKSDEELARLRELGLSLVYMGLESGDDETLVAMAKHGDAAFQVAQARRVRAAGMKLNITVLLGLGGVERSLVHARATGEALSAMDPEQAAALTLTVIPGTPLHAEQEAGRFTLPDPQGMLRELREMVLHTRLSRGLFFANHASNYLPIRARLPRDRDAVLEHIDEALAGNVQLTPEWRRRL